MQDSLARARQLVSHGRMAEALGVLEQAEAQAELPREGVLLLVRCLAQTGDLNAAYDRQRALVPGDIEHADAQGRADAMASARLAQMAMYYEDAADTARRLVTRDPQDVEAAALLSTLVLWLEGPDAANAALAPVLGRSDLPPSLLAQALAFAPAEAGDLAARVEAAAGDSALPAQARADLTLALAQHYDRCGDPVRAWTLATQGNALAPEHPAQDWHGVLQKHLAIHSATADAKQMDGPQHLYLVGTPRSGQSLLQSIIAAAPDAFSLGERGALLQHILFRTGEIAAMGTQPRQDLFAQLAAADAKGIARMAGAPALVVDKSPLHLPVAGSVARIHPSAKFAAVLRDPADTALSIYLRSFPPVYDYANDMDRILGQLDFALDALVAWREAGLDIMLIDHAALVEQPAESARRLFDHAGLAFDPSYLTAENRTQPVATFSAAQVRQDISPRAVRSSDGYADFLEPWGERLAALRDRTAAMPGLT